MATKETQASNPKPGAYLSAPALPISSCGPEFDVKSGDAQLLAPLGYILGSQHGSVWRGLVSVSLYLHPTSHTADGLPGDKKHRVISFLSNKDSECIMS